MIIIPANTPLDLTFIEPKARPAPLHLVAFAVDDDCATAVPVTYPRLTAKARVYLRTTGAFWPFDLVAGKVTGPSVDRLPMEG